MAKQRGSGPSTPEETERANRQPGAKGHPHDRGPSSESPDVQPEQDLEDAHRRNPSGLLDGPQHRPGPRERPERKP